MSYDQAFGSVTAFIVAIGAVCLYVAERRYERKYAEQQRKCEASERRLEELRAESEQLLRESRIAQQQLADALSRARRLRRFCK
jgi:hypothetical protein